MNVDTPLRAIAVVFVVALVCSVLVSVSAITLRPIQERNERIERSRHVVSLSGLVTAGQKLTDEQMLDVLDQLDVRLVELDTGAFSTSLDVESFDPRRAANDPQLGLAIPAAEDLAGLGRRSRFMRVYLVWQEDALQRVIVPIRGQGMWSMLAGMVALEADLNTIAAATFYEQAETAGLGDQIENPDWLSLWSGRRLFGRDNIVRFRVAGGGVDPGSASALHEVDGISGATVTGDAVTRLVRYWFGSHGYAAFLASLRENPPRRIRQNTST